MTEEKLKEKVEEFKKQIENLNAKSVELETEAIRYENLASILTFEPFVALKTLVSNAVQDNAKKQDIKACEKYLKDFKAIDSIEAVLKDFKEKAKQYRQGIELNKKDIDDIEIKIAETENEIKHFQQKIDLIYS